MIFIVRNKSPTLIKLLITLQRSANRGESWRKLFKFEAWDAMTQGFVEGVYLPWKFKPSGQFISNIVIYIHINMVPLIFVYVYVDIIPETTLWYFMELGLLQSL